MLFKKIVFLTIWLLGTSQVSSISLCGQRNPFSLIVGGADAEHGSWPWQIELLMIKQDTTIYTHRCGGTLIDHQWVVTAAHCVFRYPYPSHYKIVVGEINRSEVTAGSGHSEHVYDVVCIRIHEQYMIPVNGYGFDIALLKLERPVLFQSGKVWPACLPIQGQRVAVGTECFITGWGKRSANSTLSDVLQEAKMPIVDFETCAAGNANLSGIVENKTMICAGYGGNSVVSGCHGDSGGPFVCKESGGWILRGAVSWGDDLCRAGSTFSVFVRISTFVSWIHDKMKTKCAPVPPMDSECKDNMPYCAQVSSDGYCENKWYANYLQLHCPTSCHHCNQDSNESTS